MKNYTVKWRKSALDELADIWLKAEDRQAVTRAVGEIESRLEESPTEWGIALSEGLRSFGLSPLRVLFFVVEERRIVRIVAAKSVPPNNERADER